MQIYSRLYYTDSVDLKVGFNNRIAIATVTTGHGNVQHKDILDTNTDSEDLKLGFNNRTVVATVTATTEHRNV